MKKRKYQHYNHIYKISTNFLKRFWITFPFYSKPQSIHKLHRPSCVLIRQSQTCCVMLREDTCWTDVYAWYIIFFFLSYWFYPPGLNDIPRIQKDIYLYIVFLDTACGTISCNRNRSLEIVFSSFYFLGYNLSWKDNNY